MRKSFIVFIERFVFLPKPFSALVLCHTRWELDRADEQSSEFSQIPSVSDSVNLQEGHSAVFFPFPSCC